MRFSRPSSLAWRPLTSSSIKPIVLVDVREKEDGAAVSSALFGAEACP